MHGTFVKKQEHRPAIGKGAAGLSRARLYHRLGRVPMRVILAFAAVVVMALTAPAFAQQSANPQQERMKACNTQAGTQHLSGDARKTFMSNCLAGKTNGSGSTAANSQQERMKACNTQAGTQHLTGDARKTFMSTCLKGQ
jgi:carboxypeptidase C (cathepsin A)